MTAPLVLLHGWGSTPAVWAPLIAELGADFPPIAPPLPGHGIEDDAPADLDFWCSALLDRLPQGATLCGWSLGGLLALRLARLAPDRVAKLVLIGASPCFVRNAGWPHGLDAAEVARFESAFASEPEELQKRFLALQVLGEKRRRPVLEALLAARAPLGAVARRGMAGGLRILAESDLRGELAAIAQPVRILHGAGDALMPVGAALASVDALRDGRLSVFEDCGHAPHLSRARDCAVLIGSFAND